jgi:hypothetical protein
MDWIPITLELRAVMLVEGNYVGLGDVDDSRPDAPYSNPFFEWWVADSFLFGGGLSASATINSLTYHTDPNILLNQYGVQGLTEYELVFRRPADNEGWGCEALPVSESGTVHTSRQFADGTVTIYDTQGQRFDDWQVVDSTHIEIYGGSPGTVYRVCYLAFRTDQLRSQPRSPKSLSSNTSADKLQFGDRPGKF